MRNLKEDVVGLSMKKLNTLEMEKIYGASGVDTRTHPTVIVVSRTSSKACLSGVSAISGLLSYNKDCIG